MHMTTKVKGPESTFRLWPFRSQLTTHNLLLAARCSPLPPRRGLAVGEEGFGGDLRYLAAGRVVVGPEVGAVVRRDARLGRPTAGVALDQPAHRQALDVEIEGAARRDIL